MHLIASSLHIKSINAAVSFELSYQISTIAFFSLFLTENPVLWTNTIAHHTHSMHSNCSFCNMMIASVTVLVLSEWCLLFGLFCTFYFNIDQRSFRYRKRDHIQVLFICVSISNTLFSNVQRFTTSTVIFERTQTSHRIWLHKLSGSNEAER